MKRSISFLLVMLMCFSLFAACSTGDTGTASEETAATDENSVTEEVSENGEADDGDKEAVELTITYATGDVLTAELLHACVEDFMAANPHVTIVEKLSNEGAYLDSIKTLDAVGEFPDVIEMRDTALYVRAGKLGELPDEIMGKFDSPIDFDGKYYTAPMTEATPNGIVYNVRLFEELNINVDEIKTYDDFLDVCETIKNAGTAPIVIGGSDIWHIGFWWSFFWHQYVAVDNPDWIASRYADEVSFTDDNIQKAMERMTELFDKGYVEAGWASTAESQCPSILVSEQAAMYYIGPFAFAQIEEADPDFEFGFFAVPDDNGNINISGGATAAGWAINKETQDNDPAKTEAVYDFINFFFEDARYAEYLKALSAIPTIDGITYDASPQLEEALKVSAEANDKQLTWNSKVGENELPPNFRNYCYKLCSEWFLGVSSIEDGLELMEEEWINSTKDFNPVTGVGLEGLDD